MHDALRREPLEGGVDLRGGDAGGLRHLVAVLRTVPEQPDVDAGLVQGHAQDPESVENAFVHQPSSVAAAGAAPSAAAPPPPIAASDSRSKKCSLPRVDTHPDLRPGAGLGADPEATDHHRAMCAGLRLQVDHHRAVDVLEHLAHLLGHDRRGLDLDVGEHLGAEQLGRDHLAAQRRLPRRVAGERRVLELLGTDRRERSSCRRRLRAPGPVARPGRRARRASATADTQTSVPPSRSSRAWTRFIAGLPMKLATNRLAGRLVERLRGRRTCCSSPLRSTATRSPIVIASTWSCVT